MPNIVQTMSDFPATYGEVMKPLDLDALPSELAQRCSTSPMIREWVHLYDRVLRAEKVSSPTQWSPLEVVIYEHDDWTLFSRLRGYTTCEIADFKAYLALCESVKRSEPDGENFLLQASLEIQRLVSTEAFRQVEARLLAMSQAQPLAPNTTEESDSSELLHG